MSLCLDPPLDLDLSFLAAGLSLLARQQPLGPGRATPRTRPGPPLSGPHTDPATTFLKPKTARVPWTLLLQGPKDGWRLQGTATRRWPSSLTETAYPVEYRRGVPRSVPRITRCHCIWLGCTGSATGTLRIFRVRLDTVCSCGTSSLTTVSYIELCATLPSGRIMNLNSCVGRRGDT